LFTTNLDVVDIDGAVDMASTLLVTGVLTTTAATVHTGGITMPNNAKAIFGTGSSLEIYGDGSNSYIDDAGTGGLILRADNAVYLRSTDNENMVYAEKDGPVNLYHNNAQKLATTATGISVTGTVWLVLGLPCCLQLPLQVILTQGCGFLQQILLRSLKVVLRR
jgi:hypothetical protein